MLTEDLLRNVNYSPASTVSLRNLSHKRELGIVVSDEYVYITVTVEEVGCNCVPWAQRNLWLDFLLFLQTYNSRETWHAFSCIVNIFVQFSPEYWRSCVEFCLYSSLVRLMEFCQSFQLHCLRMTT